MARKDELLILGPKDNVGVLAVGSAAVPIGHKIALKAIAKGAAVVKFGQTIGLAKKAIAEGEHVHIHNVAFSDTVSFAKLPVKAAEGKLPDIDASFQGYAREDGRAGTRNYIVIMASVNCSATVVRMISDHFKAAPIGKNIDGVVPVIHQSGCAQAVDGRSDSLLNLTLAGWLFHPNVVGALVIGLGCEDITFESISKAAPSTAKKRKIVVDHMGIQDVGGIKKAVEIGIKKVEAIIQALPAFKRTPLPVSHLAVGLNCGGSDAFSSITANPALGIASDILVSRQGTAVLSETPECFGAEKVLVARCAAAADKKKLKKIFASWDKFCEARGVTLNNNLSPGNISGGISTILEKSLGATAKAGSTGFRQVVGYAEPITEHGLVFMDTPGFDPVSVTGQVAGGCNLIAFTTGRGSVFGCSIVPTVKISTNTTLFERMRDDMDFDAGRILSQKADLVQVGRELAQFLVSVASGRKTASESLGVGNDEFVPWQLGENL